MCVSYSIRCQLRIQHMVHQLFCHFYYAFFRSENRCIEQFKKLLLRLKTNNLNDINLLTISAKTNIDHAEKFVKLIINTDNDDGLLILYAVDSIMKNVGGRYVTLFSKTIVESFIDIFRISVVPGVRKNLFD